MPRVIALQGVHNCIVIGANDLGKRLAQVINTEDVGHSRVVAFFDDRSSARLGALGQVPLAGGLAQVAAWVKTNHVQTIYIALPMASQPRILALLVELRDTTVDLFRAGHLRLRS